jgi:tetratricopeptide (TPR) repeat protein
MESPEIYNFIAGLASILGFLLTIYALWLQSKEETGFSVIEKIKRLIKPKTLETPPLHSPGHEPDRSLSMEPQFIILQEEKEIDKVLNSQLFLETPEGKIGRNWDEIKETVYYEKCEFNEMKEGNILVIHGDIGIGKTTYLLFFIADCLKKGEHVIFIDPSFIEGSLKELKEKKGQIIAIDAFERVRGDFKQKCSELIDFARISQAKIILTMRSHKKAEFKNVAAHEHYEVKEVMPKPQTHNIPYIVANYLLFFNVNANGLNAEDAHRIIYSNEYEKYPELMNALEIIKEKSNVSPFYIFHIIKELKKKELTFEISAIKDLPKGVEELLLNTLKTDFLSMGLEDNVFIAILICLSQLGKDFSIRLIDAIFEELIELFSLENGENIIDSEVQNKVDQFINHFMVRTTNFEVLLTAYWREAIEKALKRGTDDSLSTIFVRVNRRISVSNVIKNALKRGLEKSQIDDDYFHLIADAAKQGFLDYAYKKFKEVKETKGKDDAKDYAMYVLTNEFVISGNKYFDLKRYKKSIGYYNMAIEINPKFITAYIDCAIAKNKLKRYKEAIKYLEDVIKLNLDNMHAAYAYNNLGVNYARIKNYNHALLYYEKAVILNSKDPLPYYNRAILYEKIKEYEKAKRDYEKAIELEVDFVEPRNKYAVLLEKMRKDGKAKSISGMMRKFVFGLAAYRR